MIPDVEAVTTAYLMSVVDGTRVVGKTPTGKDTTWVRLRSLDALDESHGLDHLISFMVQAECYAGATGGQAEASELARQVRQALVDMRHATLPSVVVTDTRITGHARMPDGDGFEPERERYVITGEIYAHTT